MIRSNAQFPTREIHPQDRPFDRTRTSEVLQEIPYMSSVNHGYDEEQMIYGLSRRENMHEMRFWRSGLFVPEREET